MIRADCFLELCSPFILVVAKNFYEFPASRGDERKEKVDKAHPQPWNCKTNETEPDDSGTDDVDS